MWRPLQFVAFQATLSSRQYPRTVPSRAWSISPSRISCFRRSSELETLPIRKVNRSASTSPCLHRRRQTSLILRPVPQVRLSTTTTSSPGTTSPFPTTYKPPTTGPLSYLPASLVPYAELARLDKPIGTYYLFLPCIFSTLLAAPLTTPATSPTTVLSTTLLFLTGSIIMRSAGCTINDIWDRRLDTHVSRTRHRPLARGAITLPSALVFTCAQLLAGLAILLQFPFQCFFYATPSLLFVALYPAAKRVTNYPQFVLGLTFSWGAIMGFPALGVDLMVDGAARAGVAALYASNVAWTVLYDMVYAHMDIRDDEKVGIRSIARRHERETKAVLAGLAVVQASLLGVAGWVTGVGWVYYAGVVGGSLVGNGLQIWKVRLEDPASCWWWFRKGVWITGGAVIAGMGAEYGMRYCGLYDKDEGAGEEQKRLTDGS